METRQKAYAKYGLFDITAIVDTQNDIIREFPFTTDATAV